MTANYTMSPSSQQVQLFLALLVAQEAFTLWVSACMRRQSINENEKQVRMHAGAPTNQTNTTHTRLRIFCRENSMIF